MFYTITFSLAGVPGVLTGTYFTQRMMDDAVAILTDEYGAVIHGVELPIIPERVG